MSPKQGGTISLRETEEDRRSFPEQDVMGFTYLKIQYLFNRT